MTDRDLSAADIATLYESSVRLKSLLSELWEGVRIHGLTAPPQGKAREGERLIHAYCGGIARLTVERDEARDEVARLRAALRVLAGQAVEAVRIAEERGGVK